MKLQACKPCAKRKVRCDRGDPKCSNCKRRKHDDCVYPEVTPDERIKQLEQTIKQLGGDPTITPAATPRTTSVQTPSSTTVEVPSTARDEEPSISLELQGWQAWVNVTRGREGVRHLGPDGSAHRPAMCLPHAFNGLPLRPQVTNPTITRQLPFSQASAHKLWKAFKERVNTVIKLSFPHTIERLQSSLVDGDSFGRLSSGEQVLFICSCYFGAVALSREECYSEFGQARSDLLSEHRAHCESFLNQTNLLVIEELNILKAVYLYIQASVDLVTSQSLWSLAGLAGRAAESLGLHREGEISGLQPFEVEERRRLWWQTQHIDLIMAVKNGRTPLVFTADWDTKLPLNINDRDISSDSILEPRTGLTDYSYSLFAYWVLDQQRKFRVTHKSAGLDQSLIGPLTENIIDKLESGLQQQFLQYCDPVKGIDALLLISARGLINLLRLRNMHEKRLGSETISDELHDQYFDSCIRQLGYTVTGYSQPCLKPFRWLAEASFNWHALIALLVDLPRINDVDRLTAAWEQLQSLYAVAVFLKDFTADQRRSRAAQLSIAAWEACASKPGTERLQKPAFVTELEQVRQAETQTTYTRSKKRAREDDEIPEIPDTLDEFLDFNFTDIDWLYWQ